MASARLLDGKIAVITGAARGIGRATAVAMACEGANIVGIDICTVVKPMLALQFLAHHLGLPR